MALESHRYKGIAKNGKVELEAGANLPDGAEVVVLFREGAIPGLNSSEDVMGGDVCIRDTRIAVWMLVDYKRRGLTDAQLLAAYPTLNQADLVTAWDYYAAHSEEIESQRRRHEDAA